MRKGKKGRDTAVSITTARTRLFELVEDVLSGRSARVEISHRSYDEHLLLVRKRDVLRLEDENRLLRSRVAPEPVPLRGMGRLIGDGTPDDVVERVRAKQGELARRKRASLLEVSTS